MKKLLILIIISVLTIVVISCDDDPYYYHTATNHSLEETVMVNFHRGTGEFTFLPGETKNFALLKGTQPGPSGIAYYSPEMRISAHYNGNLGRAEFYDRQAFEIKIINYTGIGGILRADGWMMPINFSSGNTEQTNPDWLIYSNTPNFTATLNGGFPVSILHINDNNIIKVTIGNPPMN